MKINIIIIKLSFINNTLFNMQLYLTKYDIQNQINAEAGTPRYDSKQVRGKLQLLKQTQYMKRFYQIQNSQSKLERLFQHYVSQKCNQRFLLPKILNIVKKNQIGEEHQDTAQASQSILNFNLCPSKMLEEDTFKLCDQSSETIALMQTLQSLNIDSKVSQQNNQNKMNENREVFNMTLNYIPYKVKQKTQNTFQKKFKKQLETVQIQWIKYYRSSQKQKQKLKFQKVVVC